MKIKKGDYDRLKQAIASIDRDKVKAHAATLKHDERVKDLNKRLRWDCLYACGLKIGDGAGMPGDLDLYAYMHDDHIDTALRSIMRELDLERS